MRHFSLWHHSCMCTIWQMSNLVFIHLFVRGNRTIRAIVDSLVTLHELIRSIRACVRVQVVGRCLLLLLLFSLLQLLEKFSLIVGRLSRVPRLVNLSSVDCTLFVPVLCFLKYTTGPPCKLQVEKLLSCGQRQVDSGGVQNTICALFYAFNKWHVSELHLELRDDLVDGGHVADEGHVVVRELLEDLELLQLVRLVL